MLVLLPNQAVAPDHADNPASLPCGSLEEARAAFLQQHGAAYGYSGWLDANYQAELGKRLEGQQYLDWTGKWL